MKAILHESDILVNKHGLPLRDQSCVCIAGDKHGLVDDTISCPHLDLLDRLLGHPQLELASRKDKTCLFRDSMQ